MQRVLQSALQRLVAYTLCGRWESPGEEFEMSFLGSCEKLEAFRTENPRGAFYPKTQEGFSAFNQGGGSTIDLGGGFYISAEGEATCGNNREIMDLFGEDTQEEGRSCKHHDECRKRDPLGCRIHRVFFRSEE